MLRKGLHPIWRVPAPCARVRLFSILRTRNNELNSPLTPITGNKLEVDVIGLKTDVAGLKDGFSSLKHDFNELGSRMDYNMREIVNTLDKNMAERLHAMDKNIAERLHAMDKSITDKLQDIEGNIKDLKSAQQQHFSSFYLCCLFGVLGLTTLLVGSSWVLPYSESLRLDNEIRNRDLLVKKAALKKDASRE